MDGGLFEGIKKCYCGKNVTQKHLMILLLCFLLTLPTSIAQSKLGFEAKDVEIYAYLFQNPLLAILLIVVSILWTLYLINFTHNALKFFVWSKTQEDQTRIDKIQIMPEINNKIFSYIGQYLGFSCCWIFIYALIFVALVILTIKLHVLGIICTIIASFIISISAPYILVGFSKNYTIKGNISPALLFQYTKGTILATSWLYLRLLGISLLATLALFIIAFIAGIIVAMFELDKTILTNVVFLSCLSTIFGYISMLIYFGFYYSAAYIYNEKIQSKTEIL